MLFETKAIKKYWENLESKTSAPKNVSKVSIINFEDLKKSCKEKNEFYIKSLIKKMYNGNAVSLGMQQKKI